MKNAERVVKLMKADLVQLFQKKERLEGLFVEASAGGIVWKRDKKKKGKGAGRKYAYYQYYEKKKPRGRRKVQKYIKPTELKWAVKWIAGRRKQWKQLLEIRKEIKQLIRALKVFGVDAGEIMSKIRNERLEKEVKKVQKKPHAKGCRYMTARGELVRSRSERKIANELFAKGIEYVYEKKLIIKNKCFIPDFTLRIGDKTVYLEHLGLLNMEEYAKKWKRKKEIYEKEGIIEGVNLIITKEEDLNALQIEKELKAYY